jgi:NAD dependent epimerase/dehydratase family enzyme
MLRALYPAFWAGLGGRLGHGRQWVPWVALDDLVDIYWRLLVDRSMAGPVNAVSPNPVRNSEYCAVLARVLKRPAVVAVPAWAPALVLRKEGAREFALAGQRVAPARLRRAGHDFRYPTLELALSHTLGRQGAATN